MIMNQPLTLKRYSPPSKLDQLPFGTQIVVEQDGQTKKYLQFSHDEEQPAWHCMSDEETE